MTPDRAPAWRKSSHSGSENGDCVEVAAGGGAGVPVRDSKNPAVAPLVFPRATWRAFVRGVKEHAAG